MEAIDPEIDKLLKEQEQKYFDLVHYARAVCGIGFEPDPELTPYSKGIAKMYPNETKELHSNNRIQRNWEHGFNSGCLAMVRLIWSAAGDTYREIDPLDLDYVPAVGPPYFEKLTREELIQDALEEFPFLDT